MSTERDNKKRHDVIIKMSKKDAYELGLLICVCGWPKNNHYKTGKKECAHTPHCKGYNEIARRGKLLS